jgi:hypothetical protein
MQFTGRRRIAQTVPNMADQRSHKGPASLASGGASLVPILMRYGRDIFRAHEQRAHAPRLRNDYFRGSEAGRMLNTAFMP